MAAQMIRHCIIAECGIALCAINPADTWKPHAAGSATSRLLAGSFASWQARKFRSTRVLSKPIAPRFERENQMDMLRKVRSLHAKLRIVGTVTRRSLFLVPDRLPLLSVIRRKTGWLATRSSLDLGQARHGNTVQVLSRWSLRAVATRYDKRRQQQEIDIHRLFLITTYFRDFATGGGTPSENYVTEVAARAEELGFEGQQSAVAANLQEQLLSLIRTLHDTLRGVGDPTPAAAAFSKAQGGAGQQGAAAMGGARQQRRGLAAAVGAGAAESMPSAASASSNGPEHQASATDTVAASSAARTDTSSTDRNEPAASQTMLSMHQLSDIMRSKLGYSLRVVPSAVLHEEAGDGLWLEGQTGPGAIVALYPGIVYLPLNHRAIPGYPRVDRDNPYLLARFDGAVLDAKPWGRGHLDCSSSRWIAASNNSSEANLELLEGRNPLAMAHFANHPPAGSLPNVMVAALDFTPSQLEPWGRAYFPNITYSASVAKGNVDVSRKLLAEPVVQGLALVALRNLQDEEIFLNYRLSPHMSPPSWYQSVDADEDKRRWA